jgi:hypothetical protein
VNPVVRAVRSPGNSTITSITRICSVTRSDTAQPDLGNRMTCIRTAAWRERHANAARTGAAGMTDMAVVLRTSPLAGQKTAFPRFAGTGNGRQLFQFTGPGHVSASGAGSLVRHVIVVTHPISRHALSLGVEAGT